MDIDGTGIYVNIARPYGVDETFAGEYARRMVEEVAEQTKLDWTNFDPTSIAAYPIGAQLDFNVSETERLGSLFIRSRLAQQRADASDQFVRGKGPFKSFDRPM